MSAFFLAAYLLSQAAMTEMIDHAATTPAAVSIKATEHKIVVIK